VVWSQDFECGDYGTCKGGANGWKYELIQPDPKSASVTLEPGNPHGGKFALHAVVPDRNSGDKSSKAMIAIKRSNQGKPFKFRLGSTLRVTTWYWLAPHASNAYLLDLENSDEGNSGVRFYVAPDGTVAFNRDKIGVKPHVVTNPDGAKAPTGRWFKFEVELMISKGSEGRTQIRIDDQPALEFAGQNAGSFKYYDSIQLGYTVSQKRGELWMDDAKIAYGPGPNG
jgi:hypothetical protein